MRETICVNVDHPTEREAVAAWFARWRDQLSHVSENEGCGCCVDLWHVEGPDAAIAELPAEVRTTSDWTRQNG